MSNFQDPHTSPTEGHGSPHPPEGGGPESGSGDPVDREIRHLRARFWSERDPDGRGFAPLADACRRAGDLDQALELLEDGLNRLPDYATGHVVAGLVHRDRGDLEAARAALERTLELDPANVSALRSLVEIHLERAEAEAAREHYRRLAEVAGPDPSLERRLDPSMSPLDTPERGPGSISGEDETGVVEGALDVGGLEPDGLDVEPADPSGEEGLDGGLDLPLDDVDLPEGESPFSREADAAGGDAASLEGGLTQPEGDPDVPEGAPDLGPDDLELPGGDLEPPEGDLPVPEGGKIEAADGADEPGEDGPTPEPPPGADPDPAPVDPDFYDWEASAGAGESGPQATGSGGTDSDGSHRAPGPAPGAEEPPGPGAEEPALEPEAGQPALEPDAGGAPVDPDPAPVEGIYTRTLGDLYARQGLHDRALEVYEHLVARAPDDAELRERLDEVRARVHAAKGGESADFRSVERAGALPGSGSEEAGEGAERGTGAERGEVLETGEGPVEQDAPQWTERAREGDAADVVTPFGWAGDGAGAEEASVGEGRAGALADEGKPVRQYFEDLLAWVPGAIPVESLAPDGWSGDPGSGEPDPAEGPPGAGTTTRPDDPAPAAPDGPPSDAPSSDDRPGPPPDRPSPRGPGEGDLEDFRSWLDRLDR